MDNNKKLRVGVYGILIKENTILMVAEQSGAAAIYNFPGGGVGTDEGLVEALTRECKEEIEVDVQVKDLFYTTKTLHVNEAFPNQYQFYVYYIIEVRDPELIKNGIWFPVDKLPLDKMLPGDKEFASFLQAQRMK